jgi:hypothetical protein
MSEKPPFLSNNPAASGGGGGSGPGNMLKDRPQKSGTPNFNPDSVPKGGLSAIPPKGKYNDSNTGKPFKGLTDGDRMGDDIDDAADMD